MYKIQFPNRPAAGVELARVLQKMPGIEGNATVLAMPGGGAPVAAEIARYLVAPLYPLCVRKLRIPGHDNMSMGALAPLGVQWLDEALIDRLGIAASVVRKAVQKETLELESLEDRGDRDFSRIAGSVALIVADGIADSMHDILAALEFVRELSPLRLMVAAPVVSAASVASLADKCDELVCLHKPDIFVTADYWYGQRIHVPGLD